MWSVLSRSQKNVEEMSIDELHSSLLVHEQRMKSNYEEEQALKVSTNGRGSSRGRGWSRGGRNGGRGGFDKSNIQCYRCHGYGHFKSECTSNLSYGQGEQVMVAEKEEEEEILLMAYHEEANSDVWWYLDSGCSNHMCGKKYLFSDYDESFNDTVKLGNNAKMNVVGKGSIKLNIGGHVVRICDVFYVPDLKSNLISIEQLQEKEYTVIMRKGCCQVIHPEKGLIAQVTMTTNRMFPLHIQHAIQTCYIMKMSDISWLWHMRYGHLNFNGLKTLQQRSLVTGLPHITCPTRVCEECVVGKQHRNPFPIAGAWRAKKILQLVHSDICGPINPVSNGHKRYFITFTDDFSRKTWVYFMEHKSEALGLFKSFKTLVEKESGKEIKILRTDRGGEYNSSAFMSFCASYGIRRQLTTAYSPQQNGVSERKNRTILNMVRSMLKTSGIPKEFWPEAVNWSVHVLNRSPTVAVKHMTPEEAWSDRKPTVDHFKVFGCIAYSHVPDENRRKLDDKGVKCIFLGVSEESKAYRLFNPITKKIIISRDVVFDEENSWDWNDTGKQQVQVNLDEGRVENSAQEIETPIESTSPVAAESPIEVRAQSPHSPRAQRERRRPVWMTDYESGSELTDDEAIAHLALFSDCDPITYEEAAKETKWREAMNAEMNSIEKNDTWELAELPKGQKSIGVKWVYKTKLRQDGGVDKYKARLVAKGYKQKFGVDYQEVFAPVAKLDTVRLVLCLAAQNSWPVYQLDVKSAFLHGELAEEVYIDQPPGYVKEGHETQVYRLKKALYGLKQAPRAWYSRIDAYFTKEGFLKCPYEHTLYTKLGGDGRMLIVCLYVDDLIYTGNDSLMFDIFKKSMMEEFEMTDLGLMHYFLGIEVVQSPSGIFISQKKYVLEILERFKMKDCNSVCTPTEVGLKLTRNGAGKKVDVTMYKQIVGSLMYLTTTRPDIMHAVSLISRYMENPTEDHLLAAKRIFRYVKGTANFGILYKKVGNLSLFGFSDSDYAGDIDDRKSTSGFVFMMGSAAISWSSKKQQIVTLSTTEAEFVAAASCSCQAIWLRRLLEVLHNQQQGPTLIYCDSSSAIKLSKNSVLHGRSKHIDVRYHFLRDLSKGGVIELVYCRSEDQVADILTKPLKSAVFVKLRRELGVSTVN